MLSRTSNRAGFTIIEVVITIAIGAAVMALVLNAVAGARRSQRNNARVADVGTITGAINDYVANRNALPTEWANIDNTVEDLNQYQRDISLPGFVFQAGLWEGNKPANPGEFLEWGTASTNGTIANAPATTTTIPIGTCPVGQTVDTSTTPPTCSGGGPYVPGIPSTTGIWALDADQDRHDYVVVIREARCNSDNNGVADGGLRRIVIVYKLEGQDGITCRDI